MSFWPFSTSANNTKLRKFLDSVQDPLLVSVSDLLEDKELQQELVSELHNIKGSYNKNANNFTLLLQFQLSSNDEPSTNASIDGVSTNLGNGNSSNNLLGGSIGSTNADSASISSFNDSSLTTNVKGAKMIEILTQAHILSGLLDYIIESVLFFQELAIEEDKKLQELIHGSKDKDLNDAIRDTDMDGEMTFLESSDSTDSDSGKDDTENDIVEANEEEEDDDEQEELTQEKSKRCIQAAADILSMDLWIILNRIIETPHILSKLWGILSLEHLTESTPPVTYLIRILDQLMETNSIELLNFIRNQKNLVETFMNKIEVPVLMDFLLRVIQTDKFDNPTGIVETLHEQRLIGKMIEILKPDPSQFVKNSSGIPNSELFFKQTAATDFIKALITISSNSALAMNIETNIGPNELTRELSSVEVIQTMIDEVILYIPDPRTGQSSNKHGINNCVGIVIELIRKNNSDYDVNCGAYGVHLESNMMSSGPGDNLEVNSQSMLEWLKDFDQNPPGPRDPLYLGPMLEIFLKRLDKLLELLERTEASNNKELGFTNFKISELIAELLHCSNMILLNSKKVCKVVQVREISRMKKIQRLRKALNEKLFKGEDLVHRGGVRPSIKLESLEDVNNVTLGLDDVSLDNVSINSGRKESTNPPTDMEVSDDEAEILQTIDVDEMDSEDEEPNISPDNPFVDDERDAHIRLNPCLGDFFKIQMIDLGILQCIIRKLVRFPWHNFFHNVVFDLVQQIFNGKLNSYNSFLIVELIKKSQCDLTGIIVHEHQENFKEPELPSRPGYMGHLILISEEIVKFTSLYKPDLISPFIVEAISSEAWDWFINDILLKTREVYNAVLGADNDSIIEPGQENDRNFNGEEEEEEGEEGEDAELDIGTGGKKAIILGDQSNHSTFINESPSDYKRLKAGDFGNTAESNFDEEDSEMPKVPIQSTLDTISPSHEFPEVVFEDQDGEYLAQLSGSSSSSDDEDEHHSDEDETPDDNELRRVPTHNN